MTLALVPTVDDSRTNAAFEEMMWALSRPGFVRTLPSGGWAVMAESLLDRECSFHVMNDPDFAQSLARSGARAVSIDAADYVFTTIETENKVAALSSLRIGTLAYPDEAATLIALVRFGFGQGLRLTGPGIKDSVTIALDGVDPSFWRMRAKAIRYPLGFDVYLVDGDDVIGLPRSTRIEVL
ncbi:phosphonate C-P lyase system protein PhnH [Mesorhizobium sp. B4-1-4]|uniref:phosphonate C-P lyase system protein PhnH n=1 Tax=Mesorhizobium sp. B4-1-4 TaxID=2589888 RepID=UPI0011267BD7|nr:phosphonate C-P lyase system protein PhnH [Mesorhizobium sp. B4-1-4]UCI31703.1 phosphonate C-P lyase system protein PhnH [Mesorhizobium sp. B4-1-4]